MYHGKIKISKVPWSTSNLDVVSLAVGCRDQELETWEAAELAAAETVLETGVSSVGTAAASSVAVVHEPYPLAQVEDGRMLRPGPRPT